jgi:excisionase family DNA binding protein
MPRVKPTASNLPPGIALDALPYAPGSQSLCPHCYPQSEITRRKQALAVALPDAVNRGMREEPAYDRQTPSRASGALLTIDEVAIRLNISTKSVRRRIKAGLIRKASLGGRTVRIPPDEVQRLIAGTPLEEASEDPDISQY